MPRAIKILRWSLAIALPAVIVAAVVVKFRFMQPSEKSKSAPHSVADSSALSGVFGEHAKERRPLTLDERVERIRPMVEGLL